MDNLEMMTKHAEPKLRKQPNVTQSRFFSQEFNTAIIDGPLRIYFSGRQESKALQVYFEIQERLAELEKKLSSFGVAHPHLYLLLYPTKQSFLNVFTWEDQIVFQRYGEHLVMAVDCSEELDVHQAIAKNAADTLEFAFAHGDWALAPENLAAPSV